MDESMAVFVEHSEIRTDIADRARMQGLAELLDHASPPWPQNVVPPLGHWLLFWPSARQSALGPDGHPERTADGLLPANDLPRRMWAGSRVRFHVPIPIGETVRRTSTLVAATPKSGRSGTMVFATVRHELLLATGVPAIVEDQDIVYRAAHAPGSLAPAARYDACPMLPIVRTIVPDPTLLLRYSALTFNAHRIHYDMDYARDIEGYPGLVVHGPMMATLLLDHFLRQRPGQTPTAFAFRAVAPLFAGQATTLGMIEVEDGATLIAAGPLGVTMRAEVSTA